MKTILEDQRKKQNDINSDARLKRREDMLARARRTPSPPPNAGDSARVSPPRDAECAAATPTLGEEGEEEEEEERRRKRMRQLRILPQELATTRTIESYSRAKARQ